MLRVRIVACALTLLVALVTGGALAQPQGPPPGQQHGPPGGMGMGGAGRGMGMLGGAMMGGGMMGGHAGVCAHLIGAPMPAEPRAMGRMLQLCGEMLRSMGEIMMKHGKQMETGG
jgi:hypothetical protein